MVFLSRIIAFIPEIYSTVRDTGTFSQNATHKKIMSSANVWIKARKPILVFTYGTSKFSSISFGFEGNILEFSRKGVLF
jgi:hypothetical protein